MGISLFAFLPFDECGQKMGFEIGFVADEVIIHKEDCPATPDRKGRPTLL